VTTPPAILFDLDGTLADTAADLVAAANGYFTAEDLGGTITVGETVDVQAGHGPMLAEPEAG